MPITMIPKAAEDIDTSFVKFTGNVPQSITFTHSSGILLTEGIDESSYGKMLSARCSGDPSVSENVQATVGTCTYDIAIPCNKDDICSSDTAARRMHEEAFTHETSSDGDDEEDAPYCLSEDFPCEGEEEENMVYVCHYVPSQGYQTFCVPEADTVILGFYPNDYCGPCKGGYRSVEK